MYQQISNKVFKGLMKIFSFFLVCLSFLVGEMFSQTLWTVDSRRILSGLGDPRTCSSGMTWDSS